MWAILAAVPALLDAGQKLYEAITGKPSQAQTADALQTEVSALPPDQQGRFMSEMQAQIDLYQKENERLVTEEGNLDAATLTAIGPDAAKQVALLRMTTRPWTVRKMVHLLLLPFYVTLYDMAVAVVNNFAALWGYEKKLTYLATMFFAEKSLYRSMYEDGASAAMYVVLAYMCLREVGKANANGSSIGQQVGGLISSVGTLFKRK